VSAARSYIVGFGLDVFNLTWTFRWLSAVDIIFWDICAYPIPLLSLEFGWLYGVNDRVSSVKDGSWSEV